jgi:hypothetical protein
MFSNRLDFDAALARSRDLLLAADRERMLRNLREPGSSALEASRRRLGALLIRIGRRLEGIESAQPVVPAGSATRA